MLQHDKQKIGFAKIKDRSLCNEILGMKRNSFGDIQFPSNKWSEMMIAPNQLVLSKMRDVNGAFTLHHACNMEAPEHVIDLLIANNKIAVGTKSDHDEYPLSLALARKQPEPVVLKILRAFPEAAKYQDKGMLYYYGFHLHNYDGSYPLHMACNDDVTDDNYCRIYGETLVRELIEAFPDAARHKVIFGRYPLHLACFGYHQQPIYYPNKYTSKKFKVIHELIEVFPDAVKHMEDNGLYPLSFITDEAPQYLVETLLADNTVAIETQSDGSNNPLLSGLQFHQLEPVVLKLLAAFPEAAKQQEENIRGWYPLHMACNVGKYETLVLELIKVFPEAAKHMDCKERYPLHLACFGHCFGLFQSSFRVIKKLITVFPDAVRHKDQDDHYPLHIACDHNAGLSTIKALVSHYPEALLQVCVNASGQKCLPVDLAFPKLSMENYIFLRDATANQRKHCKPSSESGNTPSLEETEDKDNDNCGAQGKMKRKKI